MARHPLSEFEPEPTWSLLSRIEAELGAFTYAPCEAETKSGQPCGNAAMKFSERPYCHVHGTDKEAELNRMKNGTARSRLQNERIFGDM